MIASTSGEQRIDNAIALCRQMWEQGVLNAKHDALSTGTTSPVPPVLSVCVMSDGSAAVIPAPETACMQMGLAPLKH